MESCTWLTLSSRVRRSIVLKEKAMRVEIGPQIKHLEDYYEKQFIHRSHMELQSYDRLDSFEFDEMLYLDKFIGMFEAQKAETVGGPTEPVLANSTS